MKAPKMIQNAKLRAIAQRAADNLMQSVAEGEEKILEAWHAAEEEAQDNETAPKFKLGYGIALNLEADAMETKLSFGVKHCLNMVDQIPDENQMELPTDEDSEELKETNEKIMKGVMALSKLN